MLQLTPSALDGGRFGAARQAVRGVGSRWGGLRFAPTPLRALAPAGAKAFARHGTVRRDCPVSRLTASDRGRVAKLALLTSFATLKQSRRVSLRSALCAPTPLLALQAAPGHRPGRSPGRNSPLGLFLSGLAFSSPQRSPSPGSACRESTVGLCSSRSTRASNRRARAGRGAPAGRRGAQGSGPRAQRASITDSSRVFERRERSEQSEFRDGATSPSTAGQSERSVDRHAEAPRPVRARLGCSEQERLPSQRSKTRKSPRDAL